MKLDDRDIVCQRDFSPLSAAELMAEIELYTDIALNSPLRDSDPEEILGPARALLARAEAAEADTADAEDLLEETESELSRFMDNLIAVVGDRVIVGDEVQFSAIVEAVTALLARAEAAEAEAGQLRDELAAMTERVTFARRSASLAENALETARSRWDEAERREKSIFDSAMGIADQRDTLATRVAELEAALDAERAAWQWRPVTEDWPHYHDRVVIAHWGGTWAQFARRVQSDDGEDEWLLDDGRKFDFESASVALLTSPPPLPHWMPLPSHPDGREFLL